MFTGRLRPLPDRFDYLQFVRAARTGRRWPAVIMTIDTHPGHPGQHKDRSPQGDTGYGAGTQGSRQRCGTGGQCHGGSRQAGKDHGGVRYRRHRFCYRCRCDWHYRGFRSHGRRVACGPGNTAHLCRIDNQTPGLNPASANTRRSLITGGDCRTVHRPGVGNGAFTPNRPGTDTGIGTVSRSLHLASVRPNAGNPGPMIHHTNPDTGTGLITRGAHLTVLR